MVLICINLMITGIGYIITLVGHLYISFVNLLLKAWFIFKNWAVCFLIIDLRSSSYTDIPHLAVGLHSNKPL